AGHTALSDQTAFAASEGDEYLETGYSISTLATFSGGKLLLTFASYCFALIGVRGNPEKYCATASPNVLSSFVNPPRIGILLNSPLAYACSGGIGTMVPSTTASPT